MLTYPTIDPVIVSIGPISVHWYGVMYLLGFAAAWWLGVIRAKSPGAPVNKKQVEDMIFYGAMGAIIGGRIGYTLFYGWSTLLENPLWVFKVWEGGMSFHGGLLGVAAAMWLFSRKMHQSLLKIWDFLAPLAPIGLGLGRIGNFIGQELWGRPTEGPWGMVFPNDPLLLTRHPSQLYQAFLEGLVLFCIVWFFSRKPRPTGAVTGLFLLGYGCFRFLVEFVRQPDQQIGFEWFGWVTRGQQLSLPMIIGGAILLGFAYYQQRNRV